MGCGFHCFSYLVCAHYTVTEDTQECPLCAISMCAWCLCMAPKGAGSMPWASALLKGKKEKQCIWVQKRGSSFRQQERQNVFHLQPAHRQTQGGGQGCLPSALLLSHLLSSGCHVWPHAKGAAFVSIMLIPLEAFWSLIFRCVISEVYMLFLYKCAISCWW